MYSHDLQIKYLQFRSSVEMNTDEEGMNRPDSIVMPTSADRS